MLQRWSLEQVQPELDRVLDRARRAMTEYPLERFGRLRIHETCPDARLDSDDAETVRVPAVRDSGAVRRSVAVELMRPRGGRTEYGLLGADYVPDERFGALSVHMPKAEQGAVNRPYVSDLIVRPEWARAGLPPPYAEAVRSAVVATPAETLRPGTLRFNCAAHGAVGSTAKIFAELTRLLLVLVMDGILPGDPGIEGPLSQLMA
jgi:hypothetical protein